jgi:hypothetical protein
MPLGFFANFSFEKQKYSCQFQLSELFGHFIFSVIVLQQLACSQWIWFATLSVCLRLGVVRLGTNQTGPMWLYLIHCLLNEYA